MTDPHRWVTLFRSELLLCKLCGQVRKPGDPGPATCPVIGKKDGSR